MIERVEQKFDLTPTRLVADTAYGAAPVLNWVVAEKKIEPHIPVWEKSIRSDGTFSRPDFHFDEQSNTYECPGDKKLTSTGRPTNAGTVLFRARNQDCGSCALKQQCCPNTAHRKIARSIYEEAVTLHVLYARWRHTSRRASKERRWRCCLPQPSQSDLLEQRLQRIAVGPEGVDQHEAQRSNAVDAPQQPPKSLQAQGRSWRRVDFSRETLP